MQFPTVLAKIISAFLAVVTPLLSGTFGLVGKVVDRVQPTVQAQQFTDDAFMAGVCHPEPEYKKIKKANIGWIREDIPFPYDENGKLSASYRAYKKEMRGYVRNGIKIMAITPNPPTYLEHGLDIRKAEDIPKIQEIARFYVKDLKGIAGAFQVANEMGIDRFTKPFTLREAAKFVGVQLEAMYPIRGDVPIGYNLGGLSIATFPPLMNRYNQYIDYVGVDMYFGSFENVVKTMETYTALLREVHVVTGKPLIVAEFGYIGYGEPKTKAEKEEILSRYGVHSEAEAKKDIDAFISRLPQRLRREFEEYYADKSVKEKAKLLFKGEYANHIYRELSKGTYLRGYPHSPEGQAKFFADLIPKLKALDFCKGAFIYMWNDSERCYVCGQKGCPVETGWGIVDGEGKLKPAYFAVQKAFAD